MSAIISCCINLSHVTAKNSIILGIGYQGSFSNGGKVHGYGKDHDLDAGTDERFKQKLNYPSYSSVIGMLGYHIPKNNSFYELGVFASPMVKTMQHSFGDLTRYDSSSGDYESIIENFRVTITNSHSGGMYIKYGYMIMPQLYWVAGLGINTIRTKVEYYSNNHNKGKFSKTYYRIEPSVGLQYMHNNYGFRLEYVYSDNKVNTGNIAAVSGSKIYINGKAGSHSARMLVLLKL